MGYEYTKVHNAEVARDSISGTNSTAVLHDIVATESNSVQVTVLGGSLDLVDSGTAGTEVHLTSGVDSNRSQIFTVGATVPEQKDLPECPDVIECANGKNLGLEITDSGPKVIASVLVAEEY